MVKSRSENELKLMRKSGQISARAMKKVLEAVRPGVSLIELDKIAEETILRYGGKPSFKTVPNYYWTTCLTINSEVVHGIPRQIKLIEGDILGIDLGAVYRGWHTDTAWSVVVGDNEQSSSSNRKLPFLEAGEKALWNGVAQAKAGNKIGDISAQIQEAIQGAGYSVVKSLVGHGVGKELHEEPEVPGLGKAGTGMVLKENMTLAIEAIYTAGRPEVILEPDGWTISSKDGSTGGLFEMSVIVGKGAAEVLTDWRSV